MTQSAVQFLKKVFSLTFCAFFFVSLVYLGSQTLMWAFGEKGAPSTQYQMVGYIAAKLYMCVFPFSLCLGLAARIFDTKQARALQRLIHFFLCFAAYLVFMDLIFVNTNSFFFSDVTASATVATYVKNTIPFFIGYPVTAGITALGRALTTPKEEKVHKSILD